VLAQQLLLREDAVVEAEPLPEVVVNSRINRGVLIEHVGDVAFADQFLEFALL
jgi:hypothetical protein